MSSGAAGGPEGGGGIGVKTKTTKGPQDTGPPREYEHVIEGFSVYEYVGMLVL